MSGKTSGVISLGFVLFCAAPFALAEGAEPGGDPDYGAWLANSCVSCHQPNGSGAIPALDGRPRAQIVAALLAYKQKLRSNPVMQMIAARLSDEDIAALAAYFETKHQD